SLLRFTKTTLDTWAIRRPRPGCGCVFLRTSLPRSFQAFQHRQVAILITCSRLMRTTPLLHAHDPQRARRFVKGLPTSSRRASFAEVAPIQVELSHACPEGVGVDGEQIGGAAGAFDATASMRQRCLDVQPHGLVEREETLGNAAPCGRSGATRAGRMCPSQRL